MPWWQTRTFRLSALLAGAAAWRVLLFVGPTGSDDLAYSEAARGLLGGEGPFRHGIHGLRTGYVGPIAASYALLGAGPFSLVLPNLAASLSEVALAWAIARRLLGEGPAWIAATLVALLPVHVFHATEAHPDAPAAALASLSVLLFLRAKDSDRLWPYVASGLALGAGHLVKESAFMGLATLAILGGRPKPRSAGVLAGFLAVVAAESLFLAAATGDPLLRYRSIRDLQSVASPWHFTVDRMSTSYRLFLDAPLMLFWPLDGDFPYFAFVPLAALAGALAVLRSRERKLYGLAAWPLALVLLLDFWPITLVPFRPAMYLFPRVFLVAAVPLCVLAARFLAGLSRRRLVLAGGFLAATALPCAAVLHADGRLFSAAARLAYDATRGRAVVSDPRTTGLFRLYDGYSGSRPLLEWDAPVRGPHDRVVNDRWIGQLRSWYGVTPPAGFENPAGTAFFTGLVPGRIRLRPLLAGRVERGAPEEVRIYRLESGR
jgi:4-amino-4-deoxy-L-arabinose transferase-like glycosyltransferase